MGERSTFSHAVDDDSSIDSPPTTAASDISEGEESLDETSCHDDEPSHLHHTGRGCLETCNIILFPYIWTF